MQNDQFMVWYMSGYALGDPLIPSINDAVDHFIKRYTGPVTEIRLHQSHAVDALKLEFKDTDISTDPTIYDKNLIHIYGNIKVQED